MLESKKGLLTLIIIMSSLLLAVVIVGGFLLSGEFGTEGTGTTADTPVPTDIPSSSEVVPPESTVPSVDSSAQPVESSSPETGTTVPDDDTTVPAPETTESAAETTAPAPETTVLETQPSPGPHTYPPVSGVLTSTGDYKLRLLVDWKTLSRTDDKAVIEAKVLLSYYTLACRAVKGSIIINGKTYSFTSPEIDDLTNDTHKNKTADLYTVTVEIPLTNGAGETDVHCEWNFKGTYSGEKIESLVVDGVFSMN
ncbi:MAG: hypothetical protein MJ102_01765 [Clostridia bacterium]|nr:hypothetical protein [Clostridia bacterium]